jgi:hypothetical protein
MFDWPGDSRRLTAERTTRDLPDLAHPLAAVCAGLRRIGAAAAEWSAGEPPGAPIVPTAAALGEYLERVAASRRRGVAEIGCVSSGTLLLIVDTTRTPSGTVGTVWFSPGGEPAVDRVMTLTRTVAESFGAYNAHLQDERLLLLYQSARGAELARASVPEELRQYVPDPPFDPAASPIPALLVPHEYDRRRVPAGVWWVNYWSAEQVSTLGEERVRAAGWARVVDADGGALVLAATEEPLDLSRPDHVGRLRSLVLGLGLPEAQARLRFA